MKQIFFDGKGKLLIEEVPVPAVPQNGALMRVKASLISSGTEMTAASGGGSLIRKALEHPELIGRALQLALREGLRFTAGQVRDISETWFPIGYSCAGTVIQAGPDSPGLQPGLGVAGAGAGFSNHAEYNAVPHNLLATIPDGLSFHEAAFATVGAIALQGVRRAEVTLGETVVVVGLGLIGQITAQILDAAGCHVIGLDLVADRRELASRLSGATTLDPSLGDAPQQVMALTHGIGADKVLLCAATTSSQPVNDAFAMARERGRVVMVGAMGMELDRTDFYNKELDFVISRSVGPGRYDSRYEQEGIDYPIGFVRWTEQRNLQAFLDLVAAGKLDVQSLIGAEFPIDQAHRAYQAVGDGVLGVLLTYGDGDAQPEEPRQFVLRGRQPTNGKVGLALVGAGGFARGIHLPNIKKSKRLDLRAVVSGSTTAAQVAKQTNARLAATDLDAAITDSQIDAVLIATRHDLHAQQAIASAEQGKHIFIEKPMALTVEDARLMLDTAHANGVLLTIGFNRRLAPTAVALKKALDQVNGPRTILFRVNAGPLAPTHWLNDPQQGGGRLLGEGVHFIDFICSLMEADPLRVSAIGSADGQSFTITMSFPDESVGTVVYTGLGDPAFPKERVEVFAGGGVAILDDFKTLSFTGMRGESLRGGADKGHRDLLENFAAAVQGKADLAVTGEDGLRATRIAHAALESIRTGQTVDMLQPIESD